MFNYIYVQETYLIDDKYPNTLTHTYGRGDAPATKVECAGLAMEMAKQLSHDRNSSMTRIKLFHSDRGLLGEATYNRQ